MTNSGKKGIWPFWLDNLDMDCSHSWLAAGLELVALCHWVEFGGDTNLDGLWWGLEKIQVDTWQMATGMDLPHPFIKSPFTFPQETPESADIHFCFSKSPVLYIFFNQLISSLSLHVYVCMHTCVWFQSFLFYLFLLRNLYLWEFFGLRRPFK